MLNLNLLTVLHHIFSFNQGPYVYNYFINIRTLVKRSMIFQFWLQIRCFWPKLHNIYHMNQKNCLKKKGQFFAPKHVNQTPFLKGGSDQKTKIFPPDLSYIAHILVKFQPKRSNQFWNKFAKRARAPPPSMSKTNTSIFEKKSRGKN
jgi:hypothetical protein